MSCISGGLGTGAGRTKGGEADLGAGCGSRASGSGTCELSGTLIVSGLGTTEPAVVPDASEAKDAEPGPAEGGPAASPLLLVVRSRMAAAARSITAPTDRHIELRTPHTVARSISIPSGTIDAARQWRDGLLEQVPPLVSCLHGSCMHR